MSRKGSSGMSIGSYSNKSDNPAPQKAWNNFARYVEDEYGSIDNAAEMLYQYSKDMGGERADDENRELRMLADKVWNRTATTQELQYIVDVYL